MPVRPAHALLAFALAASARAQDTPPAASAAAATAIAAAPATAPAPAPRLRATLVTHATAGAKQPTTCRLSADGEALYVTNRGDNTVTVFQTKDMTVARSLSEVGYSAWGVVEREPGQLLVANWAGSSIAILDRASGKRLGELPVGMKPSYLALSPDGKRVYSAGNFSEDASITDVLAKKPLRTIPVGRRPMGVALSADGSVLFVAACDSKQIVRIDTAGGAVLATFEAPLAATTNLVLAPDGRSLLAAGANGALLVVDAATGAVEPIAVGSDSSCVAVTPDGRTALLADYGGGSVSLVDLAEKKRYQSVPAGEGTIHVETDGRRFYTCNDKSGSVSVYRLDPEEAAAEPAQAP